MLAKATATMQESLRNARRRHSEEQPMAPQIDPNQAGPIAAYPSYGKETQWLWISNMQNDVSFPIDQGPGGGLSGEIQDALAQKIMLTDDPSNLSNATVSSNLRTLEVGS